MVKFYSIFFLVLLLCVGVVTSFDAKAQKVVPIQLASGTYNYDIIANSGGSASGTTTRAVDGTSVFAGTGYTATSGINNFITSTFSYSGDYIFNNKGTISYTLQSFTGNNAILVPFQSGNSTTINFANTTIRYNNIFLWLTTSYPSGSVDGSSATGNIQFTNTNRTTVGSAYPVNIFDWNTSATSDVTGRKAYATGINRANGSVVNQNYQIFSWAMAPQSIFSSDNNIYPMKSLTFNGTNGSAGYMYILAMSGAPVADISGTVFSDNVNEATPVANGTGTKLAAGYISCVDVNGKILATTSIADNGTYSLTNVPFSAQTDATCRLILTTVSQTVDGTLNTSSLATGWVYGTAPTDATTGAGSTTNAILSITRPSDYSSMTGQNMSVHRLPTTYARTVTLSSTGAAPTPGSQFAMNVTNTSSTASITSSDGRLLDLAGSGSVTQGTTTNTDNLNGTTSNAGFILSSISGGASLVYNSGTVSTGTVYPSTLPYLNSQLFYKYSTTSTSSTQYTFTYKIVDKLGFASSNAATYTINLAYPLPVTYTQELVASILNKEINLNWTTGNEINNKLFEIERSDDGTTWTDLASVNSFYANGTGSGHAYTFTDASPLTGVNYYRLNQVDLDGTPHYGTIIQINYVSSSNTQTAIYPNPVQSELNIINIPTNATNVVIYSISGKIISQIPVTGTSIQVAISDLPSAVYFANILDKNGKKLKSLKFVKK
jgi:hypothetical protein